MNTAWAHFEQLLAARERRIWTRLTTPLKIQAFLDTLDYSTENRYRCPRDVLRERIGHCYDGGLLAALALRRLGQRPLVLNMIPNDRDDDHMLALYQVDGYWGAVAKSNFVGLRFREPVYRTVRELVMSYFDVFYNAQGEKTLRGYTVPLNLAPFDRLGWFDHDAPIDLIAERLDAVRKIWVLTPAMEARLERVDARTYKAGMLYVKRAGLFKL